MTPFAAPSREARAVAWWLFGLCVMVFVMVVIGGLTRLTESGLSIVEWRPFTGVLPPLNEADWQALFDAYRNYPEYQKLNFWMTLDDFKTIFWLEYIHRLWGRVIGVAFLLPFLWFLFRRMIPPGLAPRLVVIFLLGAAQGAVGWYMVASGLVDRPDVSHYRLAAHFGLAALIFAVMGWTGFALMWPYRRGPAAGRPVAAAAAGLVGWVFLTMIAGALVAGLNAGLAYNTFPLMDGALVPEVVFHPPAGIAFLDNPASVQFIHRVAAIVAVLFAVTVGWWAARSATIAPAARVAAVTAAAVAVVQAGLGIATLLTFVPLALAAAHQAAAMALLAASLWAAYALRAG